MKKIPLLLCLIILISFLVRVWNIEKAPPSLYWDEMDLGYQAFSILKTGRDYFGNYPGLVVQSFADYRAPLSIYLTVPFIWVLGLTSFAVRIPAAIFGTLSVLLIYLLGKNLFKSEKVGLVAALLVCFSPWNLQYSRMAFEGVFLLTFFLSGVLFFLRGLNNSKWWIASGLAFGLSLFAYNTAKLFVPMVVIALGIIYIRKKVINRDFWAGLLVFCLLFASGLFTTFFPGRGNEVFGNCSLD